MADYPHLTDWMGWKPKYGYTDLDPFDRPIPAPTAGIFDNSNGLRTVCFNPAWSPILTGALSRLTVTDLYLSDGEQSVQDVLKFMNIVAGIGDNSCVPQSITETQCAYYPSWYAGIEYLPHNPFSDVDAPSGYVVAPFVRFSRLDTWLPDWLDDIFFGVVENVTGYRENDIIVTPLSVDSQSDPYSGLDYPTIKLTVSGTGKLKLHFLLMPFGGRAIISTGDPVDFTDIFSAIFTTNDRIIELNRDIIASVPETDLDAIEELIFDEDTTHEIYITFLPVLNDEAPFVQYGGGFRGYELCGNLTVVDPASGEPIDFTNKEFSTQKGVIVTTYDDLLKALNDHQSLVSQAWLLARNTENIRNDVIIDKDSGAITLSQSGLITKNLPGDITALQKNSGGATFQASQFVRLFDDINTWISGGFTALTIKNLVRAYLQPDDETALDALVDAYITSDPQHAPDVDSLAEAIYSSGDFFSGVYNDAVEQTEDLLNDMSDFASHARNSVRDWFDLGQDSPNDAYLNYDVTLRNTVNHSIITVTSAGYIANGESDGWIFSNPRRVRVTATGTITNTDTGEYMDFKSRYDSGGATQASSFKIAGFHYNDNALLVPVNIVGDANTYSYIVEVDYATEDIQFAQFVNWSNVAGQIDITVEDLGIA